MQGIHKKVPLSLEKFIILLILLIVSNFFKDTL
jgi:hypothetical protein